MSLRWQWRTQLCALLAAACAVVAPGCASWSVPRIDPSGERILIWPGQTPPPPVAPPPAFAAPPAATYAPPPPVLTTPPPPPPSVGLPSGNLQAPPAYPDAGLPTTPPPVITTPPPPTAAPVITTPTAAVPIAPPPSPLPAFDAQFAFPAPTIAQAGHPLVLTTIVTRRTDRAPLSGWIVRYQVASPSAALGSAGGNQVEVPTDATGRASIEISPTSAGVGEAVVTMSVIAPPELTAAASPAGEVGRSTATISWRPGVPGAPTWFPPPPGQVGAMPAPTLSDPQYPAPPAYGPPPTDSSSTSPPYSNERPPGRFDPPPSLSDSDSPPKTYGPPPKQQQPAGKPELVVDVRRVSPERVEIGGFAQFDVVVTNRGDATARGIKVVDEFDAGLTHVREENNEGAVKYDNMRDLAPGESATVPLTFGVEDAGQLCHRVTISAEGAADVTESGCITAIDARPKTPPALEVTKQGPTRHYVGEIAKFRIVIKNTGELPVTNLAVVDHYDDAFEPRFTDPGREILANGDFVWKIARLEKGERREINVQCACVSPAASACSLVTVTADGNVRYADEKCVEIMLPTTATPPGAAGGITPPPPLPSENLKLTIHTSANPGRVGTPMSLLVFVENLGQQVQRGVSVRVQLPKGATADTTRIVPPGSFEMIGQMEVRFPNVGDVAPGQRRDFEIPLTLSAPGVVTFSAQLSAADMVYPIVESDPVQVESAAL